MAPFMIVTGECPISRYETMTGVTDCPEIRTGLWMRWVNLGFPPCRAISWSGKQQRGLELWGAIERHTPIVLTGVPASVEEAADNKRARARKHLGSHVEVRCCRSKENCLHAAEGDTLIDDGTNIVTSGLRNAAGRLSIATPRKLSASLCYLACDRG
jgi:hypothetical protein